MLVRGAAEGREKDRDRFARCYEDVIRAYLGAKWRGLTLYDELDDAVQEVFIECFRQGGVLDRAEHDRPGGFRAFLFGVIRNVAMRFESARGKERERAKPGSVAPDIARDEATLSQIFDRAWANALLREAAVAMENRAVRADEDRSTGIGARRRVELLKLRFEEDLPIREIARRWDSEAATLHKEYARAREEFKAALVEVLTFHQPGTAAELEERCRGLLQLVVQ